MPGYRLYLNGHPVDLEATGDPTLLETLQGPLALRATQAGCGMGLCGACTVLVDGRASRACSLRLSELEGRSVSTIEGLLADRPDHPMLGAWREADLPEPGECLCPSGRIMALAGLWESGDFTARSGRTVLEESICECGRDEAAVAAVARLSGER